MLISGKNSVFEAIQNEKTINKIQILKNAHGFEKIIQIAKEKGVRFEFVDRVVLDKQLQNHQNVIAEVIDFVYSSIEELLKKDNKEQLIVILDGIEDPHNFGAIIRNCECAGVDGIIISKHRAVPINDTVLKASAGAVANVKIARITNINQAIEELKENGFWIYACEADGKNVYQTKLNGKIAIIIGNEGFGISKLTKEKADEKISIPLYGKINSLNASVACGIILFEILRQKNQ